MEIAHFQINRHHLIVAPALFFLGAEFTDLIHAIVGRGVQTRAGNQADVLVTVSQPRARHQCGHGVVQHRHFMRGLAVIRNRLANFAAQGFADHALDIDAFGPRHQPRIVVGCIG